MWTSRDGLRSWQDAVSRLARLSIRDVVYTLPFMDITLGIATGYECESQGPVHVVDIIQADEPCVYNTHIVYLQLHLLE